MGSSTAPKAQAIVPTKIPTPGPSPTAKPNGLGTLGGLYDIDIGPGLYSCIVRTDEDSVSLQVKTAAQCYTEFAAGVGAGEPPCSAVHTTGGGPTPVVPGEGNCDGHHDPPPYSPLVPSKLNGFYCPIGGPACNDPNFPAPWSPVAPDTVITVGCFADVGGVLGPNVVSVTVIPNASATNPPINGFAFGAATLYLGSTNAVCTSAQNGIAPAGGGVPFPISLTRRATTRDFDGDGCTDMDELWQDKPGAVTKCGDDPWNPYDPTGGPLDVSGSYDITAEAVRADVGAPGLYYGCKADIQQSGKNLTARVLCYIDSAEITVNPQAAGNAETGAQCSNSSDEDTDGSLNDGCPPGPPAAGDPEVGGQCGNGVDDDGDGIVNDGCPEYGPSVPNPETSTRCLNSVDDDGDGKINDGCPNISSPEIGVQCDNSLDDDGDGAINDGCPVVSNGETSGQCQNSADDDGDGTINDGCVYPTATGDLHLSCPAAEGKFCGDGVPGAAPPGCALAAGSCATLANQGAGCPSLPCDGSQYQFADVDDKQTVLMGVLDNTSNAMNLSGCFEDRDGFGQLGNVYVVAKIDAHTGQGKANIYIAESHANCIAGTPAGGGLNVLIAAVRQDPGNKAGGCVANVGPGYVGCRDGDGDGCPDKRELGDTQGGPTGGGLRDPSNRWDYFNPERVNTPHAQTVADILAVVGKYGKNQGNPLYTIDTDRTALSGGNVWNLGPPDGQQSVADILAAVKQYNQNC